MEGPLRGILAGAAAWKFGGGMYLHHPDFHPGFLVTRLRELLNRRSTS